MNAKNKERTTLFYNLLKITIILVFSKSVSVDIDESVYSYVTMKIPKGTGQRIYGNPGGNNECSPSFTLPDEVYINGVLKNNQAEQEFSEDENEVILIWKQPIRSCSCMFYGCEHIIEINFT